MFYDMPKIAQTRKFHKFLVISPVLSINREVSSNCKKAHVHSFPSISSKRSKQLVYVNTNLQKILKGANAFRSKFKILKGGGKLFRGANSFP